MVARRPLARVYHLAEDYNLASILEHGLMSTKALLETTSLDADARKRLVSGQRRENVILSSSVMIRDQKPLPTASLVKAMEDGMLATEWYELLNGFVFLWPDIDRLRRQRAACGDRRQHLMVFDGAELFSAFPDHMYVSPITSGNATRRAARRGPGTFVAYGTWLDRGWSTVDRNRPPAEVVFDCTIPAAKPYLLDITEI